MGNVVHLRRKQTPDRVDSCSDCKHLRNGQRDNQHEWTCGALATPCSTVRAQLCGTPCPHFAAKPLPWWQRVWQFWKEREGLD